MQLQLKNLLAAFIASAVYGDPSCKEVRALRRFRDDKLLPTSIGRGFVSFYYFLSPSIAAWLENKHKLSTAVRSMLDLIVQHIIG